MRPHARGAPRSPGPAPAHARHPRARRSAHRAEREQNTLGNVHVDFLDKLAAAERRDEREGNKGRPVKGQPLPPPKAPVPTKRKKRRPVRPIKSKASVSPNMRRKMRGKARPAAEQKLLRADTKPSASDPKREVAQHGYEVVGPIGAGAFSTVLRARVVADGLGLPLGYEVAVKTFDAARCGKNA